MGMKIYQRLATLVQAYANCCNNGNTEWQRKHGDAINAIIRNTAPSGSGIDCGTLFDIGDSLVQTKAGNLKFNNRLLFLASYHHMDENGMYDGWTEHYITIRPDLRSGYTMAVSGRDRNQIKDYLTEVYSAWLDSDCEGY